MVASRISLEREAGIRGRTPLRASEKWFLAIVILSSIALRLILITQPFLDAWSWKQLTNAMVSRNFYLQGYHFFYPQVDWAGPYPGYIGTEFPIVPFLTSLLYAVFGIHEWIGRSISVFFFILAVPAFYLLVRKLSTTRSASVATAAYCIAPLVFFASRSFQSDIASLSFAILALFLFSEWLDDPNSKKLFLLACAATSLAILVKLPQVIIGVSFLYLCWEKYGVRLVRRKELWAFSAVSLILPLAWELHAYRISVTQYPYHFAGSGGVEVMGLSFYWNVIQRTATFGLTPVLSVALLVGLFIYPPGKYRAVFHWWLVAFLLFLVFAGSENRHPWVQLPVAPIAAAFSGFIFERLAGRLATATRPIILEGSLVAVFLLPLAFFSYWYLKPAYAPWQQPAYNAAMELKRLTPPGEIVITADRGEPAVIYYAQRKGWHFLPLWGQSPDDSAQAIRELENLKSMGATHLVFNQCTLWWLDHYKDFRIYLDAKYRRISQTSEYVIYDISGPQARY